MCRGELLNTGEGYGAKASYVDRIVGQLMVKCPAGCDASFKFKDMKCHEDMCPEVVQPCPFKDDGCVCEVKRKDMQEHLQSYMSEHIGMQCRSIQESAFDTKEAVDGVRKLVKQAYKNGGQMNLDYMKTILNKQELLENKVKNVETKLSDVYSAVGALTGFLAESHSKIMAALPGKSKSSDDFVASVKRKAEEMSRVTKTDRLLASTTPPAKKPCVSPAAPGAPGGSSPGANLLDNLPRLRDDGGLFRRVRVDEADGLDRRNGGSSQGNGAPSQGYVPTSPQYSPTSPNYSPTSPQYDPV